METSVRMTGAYHEGSSSSDRKAASLDGSEATQIVDYGLRMRTPRDCILVTNLSSY